MDEQSMMNQDQAIMMGRTSYASQDNSGISTLLSQLTNVEPDIREIELLLQGKIMNKGKIEQVSNPLCNKEGAFNMTRMMRAMVSQVMLMSNLEEEQVRVMAEELGYDVVEDLTFNKVRYEIIQPRAISTIVNIIVMKSIECGMSAMDNGTRQMLKKSIIETTINTQGTGMKAGKGGIGALLGLGRK